MEFLSDYDFEAHQRHIDEQVMMSTTGITLEKEDKGEGRKEKRKEGTVCIREEGSFMPTNKVSFLLLHRRGPANSCKNSVASENTHPVTVAGGIKSQKKIRLGGTDQLNLRRFGAPPVRNIYN